MADTRKKYTTGGMHAFIIKQLDLIKKLENSEYKWNLPAEELIFALNAVKDLKEDFASADFQKHFNEFNDSPEKYKFPRKGVLEVSQLLQSMHQS